MVAVRVGLEADDTVTVGVDHREDRLRVRIERELLVRVGLVTAEHEVGDQDANGVDAAAGQIGEVPLGDEGVAVGA